LSSAIACRPGAPLKCVAAWSLVALLAFLVDESTASVVRINDFVGEDVVDGIMAISTAWSFLSDVSHWWLIAKKCFGISEFALVGERVHDTARRCSSSGNVLISASGGVGSITDAVEIAPWSPSVISSANSVLSFFAGDGAVYQKSALVLAESSLNSTAAVRAGAPGGPQVPVADLAAWLSTSRVVDIAWNVRLFAEVVELSVSDNTGVGAAGVAFFVVDGPCSPLRVSIDAAWLSLCELESIAVLVSGMDTLLVAAVGSTEDSLASALPDLVVAIFEFGAVAISNEIPLRVDTIDCGNSFVFGFNDFSAQVRSRSNCCLFVTCGSEALGAVN